MRANGSLNQVVGSCNDDAHSAAHPTRWSVSSFSHRSSATPAFLCEPYTVFRKIQIETSKLSRLALAPPRLSTKPALLVIVYFLLIGSPVSEAQMYRCNDVTGKVSFSDAPCSGSERQHEVTVNVGRRAPPLPFACVDSTGKISSSNVPCVPFNQGQLRGSNQPLMHCPPLPPQTLYGYQFWVRDFALPQEAKQLGCEIGYSRQSLAVLRQQLQMLMDEEKTPSSVTKEMRVSRLDRHQETLSWISKEETRLAQLTNQQKHGEGWPAHKKRLNEHNEKCDALGSRSRELSATAWCLAEQKKLYGF